MTLIEIRVHLIGLILDISDISIYFVQVIFEAKKGFGYYGDIAIDQISFTRKECRLTPSQAYPNSPGVGKANLPSICYSPHLR